MKIIFLALFFNCLWLSVCGQNLLIESITQKSNYFISKTSSNKIFISSQEGLNIGDGKNIKLYNPSSHNMHGFNIQSNFYENSLEEVWFVTYEAINVYQPKLDSIEHYFLIRNDGDTIKSDYKIIHQNGDSLLIRASENLYLFDTKLKKSVLEIPIDLKNSWNEEFYLYNNFYRLISSSKDNVFSYKLSMNLDIIDRDSIPINTVSCKHTFGDVCLFGTGNGEIILYDFDNTSKEYYKKLYTKKNVYGLTKLDDKKFLVSSLDEKLFVFDAAEKQVVDSMVLKDPLARKPYSRFLFPSLDIDSVLWVGVDGVGVLNRDFKKEKFEHILKFGLIESNNRITSIKSNENGDKIAIGTRGNGLYILNSNFELISHYVDRPFIINCFWINKQEILFHYSNNIEKLNILTGEIDNVKRFDDDEYISSLENLDTDNFLISLGATSIYHLNIGTKNIVERAIEINTSELPFQSLKLDSKNNIFISKNDVSIWKYSNTSGQYILKDSLSIPGGIKCILEPTFDPLHWYVSNTHGIFKVNKQSNSIVKIEDKEKVLNGTIYGMIEDDQQNLWLSSNKGILKYNVSENDVTTYTLKDGLQDMEFNTNAYMKDDQGRIWMGGVNGLNVFHPDDVKPTTTLATVCIDDFLIDGKTNRQFGIGDYIDKVEVDYGTPFSFFFHAIDYGDIDAARLKYKLQGSDEEYVVVDDFQENIRYPNLGSGSYTLEILAANSDGVWNPDPKLIDIKVIPPFWMTWWFIILSALGVFWFTFYLFKSYYRRKIERQNVILREQELIIQSQQALELERTRIASEMHDDLGSGLTNIKYLSDKVVKTIKNKEDRDAVFRISKYSDELIRNMSEIIWAMNSRFDNFNHLMAYMRRYASEYLEEHNVTLKFEDWDFAQKMEVGGAKRRNVFLILKEALHNLVKYSGASQVQIKVEDGDENIAIMIHELDGKGFDLKSAREKGNGIYNMEKRMKDIGDLDIEVDENGTQIIIIINK